MSVAYQAAHSSSPFSASGRFAIVPRRRRFALAARILLAPLALAASGCDRTAAPAGSSPARSGGVFKVALLHPGRENDRGWNQLACDALQKLAGRPGISVKHAYSPSESTFRSDMRAFASGGYALIICHGNEYVKATRSIARDFPTARFAVTGSSDAGDGVATLDFRLWEATYLCGMLAAELVPDGPAGVIGGTDSGPVRNTLNAFVNGARAVRPGYRALIQYVGSWDDVARAAGTARSLIEGQKVRVLFQNCDAAAFGVFTAARDANLPAFGCNSDQNDAEGRVPASAVIDMAAAFEQLVEAVRSGRFEAKAYVHNLATGGVRFVPNPAAAARWTPAIMARIDAARGEIAAGRRDVLQAMP